MANVNLFSRFCNLIVARHGKQLQEQTQVSGRHSGAWCDYFCSFRLCGYADLGRIGDKKNKGRRVGAAFILSYGYHVSGICSIHDSA